MKKIRATALLVLACSACSLACSDDDPPGSGTDDGPVDCQVLTLPDAERTEEFKAVDVVPAGDGGALRDGDYSLIAHVRYRAMTSGETASAMRAALRLRRGASVMDYLFVEGNAGETGTPRGFSARVTARGSALELEMVCPEEDRATLGYTAAGDVLSIFEENEEMRFQRQ